MQFDWEDDFEMEVKIEKNQVILWANKEGLISLANHLLKLSTDDFPSGYHFHLDQYNSLEDGSHEIIIGKK
ncbi:MAG: hypothetical protein K1X72_10945 [Pyrinomonadaceae bacterium]|nr:hypothetical protein [Pyrinomonadaceae bacterium]